MLGNVVLVSAVQGHESAISLLFVIFLKIFLMLTIFKVFIEHVTMLLLCYVLIFLATKHVGF